MITSLLVANRGEIACRIVRTCRDLGIATVAVYSDADADALHARVADSAVRLPGEAPADTYLRGDLVVKAALAAGADAVHPGYGFLSENADFARAVTGAGLVWVGPPPEAIEAMASKTVAKKLMGVPVVTDPAALTEDDLPVLVKAAAGGGGRGMRVVRDLAALDAELAAARAEAASAFGDGEVFVEPYIEGGRHVEVQVLADAHGTVWTLGTRDCSLQRRHQKVIEEAPAPGLAPGLVRRLTEAAERAVRATGYVGAGTVEFLIDEGAGIGEGAGGEGAVAPADGDDGGADARVHFLEMNTRLQVEHPVTEAVFGLDLVAWQIRIAEGRRLYEGADSSAAADHADADVADRAAVPGAGAPPAPRGHAVEARLYAEDPARGWAPSTGVLHRLHVPGAVPGTATQGAPGAGAGAGATGSTPGPFALGSTTGPFALGSTGAGAGGRGLRLDTGYEDGDRVGMHYDPLLAKVVAWAPTRAEAVRRLAGALEHARVQGLVTNRELLLRSLRHPEFAAGRMDTGFYERHLGELTAAAPDPLAPVAAAVAAAQGRSRFGGFRNVPSQPQARRYRGEPDGTEYEVRYRHTRDGLVVEDVLRTEPEGRTAQGAAPGAAQGTAPAHDIRVLRAAADRVVLEAGGVRRTFDVTVRGARVWVGDTALTALPRLPLPAAEERPPGSLLAPMPGTVVRLAEGVAEGARVTAGAPLLWLEAMKMEHTVTAPATGTLTALHAALGHQVESGTLLAVVTEESPAESTGAPVKSTDQTP
ncbi:biotin carboxylase N-terminal domain-containing protein [Streptomyces sp. TS71-3]|uniref:acetyl/propionyl/methylcrotonyl-CoA carboxylase subunit alpha n=1 Tax=Streptomyces sp. TS71-3 TaxID=2733862 RepID=UPI001B1C8207|nr:biotin carboxylase N-terminal domain-containing protein [Streptomyces sp. TS71-3]GHJ39880.1 acetyl-/propionyl-CoA carboxylase subunit alpha [Streptomyces sp. TS71-3]